MKKVFILIVAFLITYTANAQTDPKVNNMNHRKMDHSMKDCVMMKDGKMMIMKNGKMMKMEKDITMSDGTVCMVDGTCKMKNGKTMMMKNGDKCDMNGKMGKMKMGKMNM